MPKRVVYPLRRPACGALLLVLLGVVCSDTAFARLRLTSIVLVGSRRVPSDEILREVFDVMPLPQEFGSQSQFILAQQKLQELISARYASLGYYHVRVDSSRYSLNTPDDSMGGYKLTVYVNEGRRYTIGTLTLTGATQFSNSVLLDRFQTRSGDVLQESVIRSDIEAVLSSYEQAGYPFAKLRIKSLLPRDRDSITGLLDIHLALDEGKRARIGKLGVLGNAQTSSDVILRELRLPVGSYYNATEIERARSRVERLGFFEQVSEPDLYLIDDSTVAIILRVKEASSSTIDGVLGYNPGRTPTESGYLNGFVNLAFRNISGTGRNGSLTYDHEDQSSQQLAVAYLEPWLFHYPLNLGLGFLERQQDTTYVRTTINASLTLLLSEDIAVTGTVAMDRVVPTDLPNFPLTVFDSKTITTGLVGTFDTRDNPVAPHRGVSASVGASYGVKSIYGPARFLAGATGTSIGITGLQADASVFLPVPTERFIFALGIHARNVEATGDSLESSDLVRLGGIRSLRGYREADFLVSRFVYLNVEYRAMTGRYSFLFAFTDLGYLFRDPIKSDPTQLTLYPVSFGLGAQVESPLGILSVSVGLAKGEPLDQAKLHFGLVKQF